MADMPTGVLLASGFGMSARTGVRRTEVETGPPKQHRVNDALLRTFSVTYQYTPAEYAQFLDFMRDNPADWFQWTDPVDGLQKQARIVGGEWSATPLNPILEKYDVSFTLETYHA